MTNRREFLHGAAAIVAAPLAAGAAVPVARQAGFNTVLIDTRHAPARAFGADLEGYGATVVGLPDGDITAAWVSRIHPAWKRARISLAGLTEQPALFCLEQLAFGHGLRVVFHGEHVLLPDGPARHRICRGAPEVAALLQGSGAQWPHRLAQSLAAWRPPTGVRFGPSEAAMAPALPTRARRLMSWMISA